jgi:hypothetical protein
MGLQKGFKELLKGLRVRLTGTGLSTELLIDKLSTKNLSTELLIDKLSTKNLSTELSTEPAMKMPTQNLSTSKGSTDELSTEPAANPVVCSVCGRTLTDPKSIERGMGPVCAQKQADQQVVEGHEEDAEGGAE